MLAKPESVLIVWNHGTMTKIVVTSRSSTSTMYPSIGRTSASIWVLVRQPGGALGYRFVSVPQMLLADDVEDA